MENDYILQTSLQHPEIIGYVLESGILTDGGNWDKDLSSLQRVFKKIGKLPAKETLSNMFNIQYIEKNSADKELVLSELKDYMEQRYLAEVTDLTISGEDFNIDNIKKLENTFIKDYDSGVEEYEVMTNVNEIGTELDDIFEQEDTINTGFNGIDNSLDGGWIKGDTYCMVAPSGVGKSIWLVNIARAAIQRGDSVCYVTTEMSIKQTKQRLYKSYTKKMNPSDIKGELLRHKNSDFKFLPIKVEPGIATVEDIEEILNKVGFNPDVIIIDYMDELQATVKGLNEYDKYKILGQDLKRLAERFDCPMVTASQTNRSAFENGATKANIGLEAIGDSWNKVKAMSGIFTIVQPPAYVADDNGIGYYELSLQKSRYSGKGSSWYKIDYKTMHISESTKEEADGAGSWNETIKYGKTLEQKRAQETTSNIEKNIVHPETKYKNALDTTRKSGARVLGEE